MSIDWQNILVLFAVGLAAAYVLRSVVRAVGRPSKGCHSCHNCGSAKAPDAPQLIAIQGTGDSHKLGTGGQPAAR